MTDNDAAVWLKWPEDLRTYLQERYRLPTAITRLYGLGHNAIWKAEFATISWIIKRSKEIRFYREIAPELERQGVPLVRLEWADSQAEGEWFVVEFIPNPLPRERWRGDTDVMRALHNLHTSVLSTNIQTSGLFAPRWDEALTQTALRFFTEADRLRPALQQLQVASQPLFESRCWISGDPNPMNWGVRNDGAVVLFDWERFGRGTPALDIAITLPGLPTAAEFAQAAAVYCRNDVGGTDGRKVERFTADLARAKVWNVVEFLGMMHAGGVADTRALTWIQEQFPAWVAHLPV